MHDFQSDDAVCCVCVQLGINWQVDKMEDRAGGGGGVGCWQIAGEETKVTKRIG